MRHRTVLVLLALLLGLVGPPHGQALTLLGSGGRSLLVQDEGSPAGAMTTLNCTGTGITCANTAGVVTVAVSGLGTTGLSDPGAPGLVQRTSAGVTAAYAGATCTNQVLRTLSATGVANCATITPTYLERSVSRMTFCEDTNLETADAYTCSLTPAVTELVLGDPITFVAASSNVGPPTLTLAGLDSALIKKVEGSITTDLNANDIRAGQMVTVIYDGVFFQMTSPTGNAAGGSGTIQTGNPGQAAYYATSGTQLSSYPGMVLTPTSQTFSPAARTAVGTPAWTFLGATEPTLASSVEATDFYINLGQLKTHLGNATIPLKRHVRISSTTDGFELPGGVIVDDATFSIGGPPIAGVNASITNSYAIWVRTAAVGATTTNSYGIRIDAPTTASAINDAALFNGGVRISGGRFDASTATRTAPHQLGAAPPGTCTTGDTFFDTDAPAGQNLYGCTALNTWTLLTGGSGGAGTFDALGGGTNTTAAMLVGTGASLGASGTGTISATHLNGAAFAGTANALVMFGPANTPAESPLAVSAVALRTASNTWTTGTQDWSGATATLPVKAGLTGATPGTCIASKELYIQTDATPGQQLLLCNAAGNGFALIGDGTGSSGHVLQNEGTPLPTRAAQNFTGTGVTCTDSAGTNSTICDIPGGGGAGAVESVFGRSGEIVAASGDYTAAQVTNAADMTSDAQVWTGSPTWASGESLTLCNTVDCTTNYERVRLSWAANQFQMVPENGGTGAARQMSFGGTAGGIVTQPGGIVVSGSVGGYSLLHSSGTNVGVQVRGRGTTSSGISNVFLTGTTSLTSTAGTPVGVRVQNTFAPTTGTATFAGLMLSDSINQTGGASGVTRGVYVAPTVTAAADYRAIEIQGDRAHSIRLGRQTAVESPGHPLAIIGGGATPASTDQPGGAVALTPGPSTGTGRSWVEVYCRTQALVSGPTENASFLCAAEGVSAPLVDGSATAVAAIALATDTGNSVRLDYQIEVVNTTTHTVQVEDGYAICRAYNTNGTIAHNTCTHVFTQSLAGGTLATTFSISAANPAVVSLLADSSLTPSTGWPRLRFWARVLGHQALTIP